MVDAEGHDSGDVKQKLVKPIFRNGIYENPKEFKTWKMPDKFKFLGIMLQKNQTGIPRTAEELDEKLPVQKVDFGKLQSPQADSIQVLWIGHASVLVQFDGVSILCDPVFSDRMAPTKVQNYLGSKRYRPAPCTVEELPSVDFVLISHDHYDHLDHGSIVKLKDHMTFGESVKFLVPMGLKNWMVSSGCKEENVMEMSWWEDWTVTKDEKEIKFVCTPTQHWCSRTLMDQNQRLWCSWAVMGPTHRYYFGGDSGYNDIAFKQIGDQFGPFSLAALPIGSYEPRDYMHPQHMSPEEAVEVHVDIHAKFSVGIHWGTFQHMGTNEPYLQPPKLVKKTLDEKGLKEGCFRAIEHGEIWEITKDDLDAMETKYLFHTKL